MQEDDIIVIETNIDDMNPQFYPHLIDQLLGAGALDAYLIPIIMKKGRPGVLLSALARPEQAEDLADLILRETTSIGVRLYPAHRRTLTRRIVPIDTLFGPIRLKVVHADDLARYTPEYEDCLKAAQTAGVPLAEVYTAVHKAADEHRADWAL